ncbi:ABC transporter ATP-binding protein [Succinispira mobilis]|uniref:ABC transporter ATP-binding protein n=1 Tax=Succinispira mobilis TaxID=78120 RepID=UPI000381A18A|nr:ABC transporter ATP-binding protein [Succinispira mobilis]
MAENKEKIAKKQVGFGGRRRTGINRFAPTAKPKNFQGTFLRILQLYSRWRSKMVLTITLVTMSTAVSISVPYYIGKSFDAFDLQTHNLNTQLLLNYLVILLSLYFCNWLLMTSNGILMAKISQNLVYVLRQEFFEKMQKLPLLFFDTHSQGDTMSRITNDIDNISTNISQTIAEFLSSVLSILGAVAIMYSLSKELTLIVLLAVPLVTGLTKLLASKSRIHFGQQQKNLGILNGIIEENITGLKLVKAFNRQDEILKQFNIYNEQLYNSSRLAQIWSGYMMPLMNVINNLIFALLALVGAVLALNYALSIGTIVSFVNYAKRFSMPLSNLAGMFNTIQSSLASAERIFEILDEIEETPDKINAVELKQPKGEVVFENVFFAYDSEQPVLKDISFSVQAGQTIALVGETGSGKTTIVNLLTRFYDVAQGRILLDGTDIRNLKRSSLRDCFAVVLQDTALFTGSIMDNIRYARCTATDEEVIAAAKLARAHNFIENLPQGYCTQIHGNIDNLSQGQKQLLSIARAVLSDSPILILDEATSSVDTKTEKDIQYALLHLMKKRTSFLIAHRLSTIRDADKIMVLNQGQIIEAGNHEQLMARKDKYYEMVCSQMGVNA